MTSRAATPVGALVRCAVAAVALGVALAGAGAPAHRLAPAVWAGSPSAPSGPAAAHAAGLGEPGDLLPTEATVMARLVNADRAAFGLESLAYDQALTDVARWRSEDMAAGGAFSHDIADVPGRVVFDVLRELGVRYRAAGENLARSGGGTDQTA